MFRTIADFERDWSAESQSTVSLLEELTDVSLAQQVGIDGRTLGRIAWHLVLTLGEMMERTGLIILRPDEDAPAPSHAADIVAAYAASAQSLLTQVREQWNDEMLLEMVFMYGEAWSRGTVLEVLLRHQAHHRGQMTVLMRQAGLKVPGLCGPSREEWAVYGMAAAE